METDEIIRRANAMVVREFELDEARLVPGATLYEDLELDSLDSVDLIAAMEREFGVKIDRQRDEDGLRSIRTLNDLYRFVRSKLST